MTPEEAKRLSRGYSTDMSGEAVARRIDIVSRLRVFTRFLATAEKLGPVGKSHGVTDDAPSQDEKR